MESWLYSGYTWVSTVQITLRCGPIACASTVLMPNRISLKNALVWISCQVAFCRISATVNNYIITPHLTHLHCSHDQSEHASQYSKPHCTGLQVKIMNMMTLEHTYVPTMAKGCEWVCLITGLDSPLEFATGTGMWDWIA